MPEGVSDLFKCYSYSHGGVCHARAEEAALTTRRREKREETFPKAFRTCIASYRVMYGNNRRKVATRGGGGRVADDEGREEHPTLPRHSGDVGEEKKHARGVGSRNVRKVNVMHLIIAVLFVVVTAFKIDILIGGDGSNGGGDGTEEYTAAGAIAGAGKSSSVSATTNANDETMDAAGSRAAAADKAAAARRQRDRDREQRRAGGAAGQHNAAGVGNKHTAATSNNDNVNNDVDNKYAGGKPREQPRASATSTSTSTPTPTPTPADATATAADVTTVDGDTDGDGAVDGKGYGGDSDAAAGAGGAGDEKVNENENDAASGADGEAEVTKTEAANVELDMSGDTTHLEELSKALRLRYGADIRAKADELLKAGSVGPDEFAEWRRTNAAELEQASVSGSDRDLTKGLLMRLVLDRAAASTPGLEPSTASSRSQRQGDGPGGVGASVKRDAITLSAAAADAEEGAAAPHHSGTQSDARVPSVYPSSGNTTSSARATRRGEAAPL